MNNSNMLDDIHGTLANDYPSMGGAQARRLLGMNETVHTVKSQINRSQIRILSTKGHRDVISKPARVSAAFESFGHLKHGSHLASPQSLPAEDNHSSQLPTINQTAAGGIATRNGSILHSQSGRNTNMSRALERDIFSAEERKRVASAFMNRRPQQGRVVTATHELRKKQLNAKSNNMLVGANAGNRQSQMDLAQSSSAYHRQLIHFQQAQKDKADKLIPSFVK